MVDRDEAKRIVERLRLIELREKVTLADARMVEARKLLALALQFSPEGVDELPNDWVETVRKQLLTIESVLLQVLATPNPWERMSLVEQRYSDAAVALRTPLEYNSLGRVPDFRAEREEVARLSIEAKATLERAEKALTLARQADAGLATNKFARHFETRAKEHAVLANTWFVRTWGAVKWLLGLTTLVFLAQGFFAACGGKLEAEPAIQLGLTKAFFLAALATIAVVCSRIYQAHLHNEIVNRHRADSLRTFRALVEGGEEATSRDIILTKAADSIFGAQPSGFGKADEGAAGPMSMVNVTAPPRPGGGAAG